MSSRSKRGENMLHTKDTKSTKIIFLAKALKRKEYSLTAESLGRGGNYNREEREGYRCSTK